MDINADVKELKTRDEVDEYLESIRQSNFGGKTHGKSPAKSSSEPGGTVLDTLVFLFWTAVVLAAFLAVGALFISLFDGSRNQGVFLRPGVTEVQGDAEATLESISFEGKTFERNGEYEQASNYWGSVTLELSNKSNEPISLKKSRPNLMIKDGYVPAAFVDVVDGSKGEMTMAEYGSLGAGETITVEVLFDTEKSNFSRGGAFQLGGERFRFNMGTRG